MNGILLSASGIVKADVLKALEIMGYGILAIFIVIVILISVVSLMHCVEVRAEANKAKPGYKSLSEVIAEKKEKAKNGKKEKADGENGENADNK